MRGKEILGTKPHNISKVLQQKTTWHMGQVGKVVGINSSCLFPQDTSAGTLLLKIYRSRVHNLDQNMHAKLEESRTQNVGHVSYSQSRTGIAYVSRIGSLLHK